MGGGKKVGKQAADLFKATTPPADAPASAAAGLSPEVAERRRGAPKADEPYEKITTTLYRRQVLELDRLALVIRERTGRSVRRSDLVRAAVEHLKTWVRPDAPDFDQAIAKLLPEA